LQKAEIEGQDYQQKITQKQQEVLFFCNSISTIYRVFPDFKNFILDK